MQYVARYSDDKFQRDHKDNQQEKNQKFMDQVQFLFNEQCDKLQQTDVVVNDVSNGFSVTTQPLNLGSLPQLNHPDDTGYSFFSGSYFQNPEMSLDQINNLAIQKPFGAQGNYRRYPTGYESGNGKYVHDGSFIIDRSFYVIS